MAYTEYYHITAISTPQFTTSQVDTIFFTQLLIASMLSSRALIRRPLYAVALHNVRRVSRIAMLIDGDNAQRKDIPIAMQLLEQHGYGGIITAS